MNISFNSNMTNIKVKRQKFGVGSLLILFFIGAVFITIGTAIVNSSKIDKSWSRVSGTVVDSSSSISNGSTTYVPIFKYQVNGQSYRVTGGTGSSSYPTVGQKSEVAYDPQFPGHAKVVQSGTTLGLLYAFPAIGVGLILLAPFLFVRSTRRSGNINNLIQSGLKVQGILTDIQDVGNNNNTSTYKLVVSATDNAGAVQSYVSDTLGGIGGLATADFRKNPIPIDVYIDPANSQNYYVDISDVPNLTPERITELIKSVVSRQPQTFVQGVQPVQAVQPPPTSVVPGSPPNRNPF